MRANFGVVLFASVIMVLSMSTWIVAQERYPSGERYPEAAVGGGGTGTVVLTGGTTLSGPADGDLMIADSTGTQTATLQTNGSGILGFSGGISVNPAGGVAVGGSFIGNGYMSSSAIYTYSSPYAYTRLSLKADDGGHLSVGSNDGGANRNFIIGDYANQAKDYDHETLSPDPHVYIHSVTDPDVDNTQWLGLWHDQTNGVLSTGKGVLDLQPAAAGVQLPGIVGTGAPAEPVACTAATARTVVYVDDTDDSAAAQLCICFATGDDGAGNPTMDWRDFADPVGTACSFF